MAVYTLAPAPYQTVLDTPGAPVPNACIWTYIAGTTTPVATYSDALGTPNTNPIRADSAGRFTAYLVPGAGYKFVYEGPATPPAHGVVLRTADNVVGAPAAAAVASGTWLPSLGGTTTYARQEGTWVRVGPLVYAAGTLVVTTLGTGSPSTIAGLPVPALAAAPIGVGYFTGLAAPVVWIGGIVLEGATQITLVSLAAAAVNVSVASPLTSGTTIQFSVVYQTAAP